MPVTLPGDGRSVLTLDEVIEALTDIRRMGGPGVGQDLVWVAGVPPLYLPVHNVRLMPGQPPRLYLDVLR